jgi:hypothetical protein
MNELKNLLALIKKEQLRFDVGSLEHSYTLGIIGIMENNIKRMEKESRVMWANVFHGVQGYFIHRYLFLTKEDAEKAIQKDWEFLHIDTVPVTFKNQTFYGKEKT